MLRCYGTCCATQVEVSKRLQLRSCCSFEISSTKLLGPRRPQGSSAAWCSPRVLWCHAVTARGGVWCEAAVRRSTEPKPAGEMVPSVSPRASWGCRISPGFWFLQRWGNMNGWKMPVISVNQQRQWWLVVASCGEWFWIAVVSVQYHHHNNNNTFIYSGLVQWLRVVQPPPCWWPPLWDYADVPLRVKFSAMFCSLA